MKAIANLGFMFAELPFLERFAAAAAANFTTVELGCSWTSTSPSDVAAAAAAAGVTIYALNTPKTSPSGLEWGTACVAGDEAQREFEAQMEETLAMAAACSAAAIHLLAGCGEADDEAMAAVFEARVAQALAMASAHGIIVLLEPITRKAAIPGYFLTSVPHALDVIDRVRAANSDLQLIGIQFDVFHVYLEDGAVGWWLDRALERAPVVHLQLSAPAARTAPVSPAVMAAMAIAHPLLDYSSELDFGWLESKLDEVGYHGFVGLEYKKHPSFTSTHDEVAALRDAGWRW
ncbi:hydroxypyruvate isomerase [Thecamonas trahens ATCC 50062]|uniref:Putative hydroxypyruvate isomerase n=1 Tax=Thecamonas trahens ATCC 50062 TaxID=461836 RepID=A0A0L0DP27_THETB|nr:hydroxypyruvate isomerase [Thecamonas trahens ATCC 50062]KNC54020.1 hydroxypyruvate isomerase [Thecamonas trahens ATCC 50062]|eukprot:XP_013754035.1 hydroxypyruvate isomerase [Thecamonas trahens ATCC 50062]